MPCIADLRYLCRMLAPRDPMPPPCSAMGPQCRSLKVILRVSTLDAGPRSGDHEATWLLGHTERLTFLSDLWEDDDDLYVAAQIHIPCRFLAEESDGTARCTAHGFSGAPRNTRPRPAARRLKGDRFRIAEAGHLVTRVLEPAEPPRRSLPVHHGINPCATARCRTADHRVGAACCRDLQIEVMCTSREKRLEALVRARKSPYLCKVTRESPFSLGAEVISACGFLQEDGIHCGLHGRTRPDGRPAKPDLCSQWPEGGDTMHPGCVFAVK
jgi:hypothetical protein